MTARRTGKSATAAAPLHPLLAQRWSPRGFDPAHELTGEQLDGAPGGGPLGAECEQQPAVAVRGGPARHHRVRGRAHLAVAGEPSLGPRRLRLPGRGGRDHRPGWQRTAVGGVRHRAGGGPPERAGRTRGPCCPSTRRVRPRPPDHTAEPCLPSHARSSWSRSASGTRHRSYPSRSPPARPQPANDDHLRICSYPRRQC